LPMLSQPEKVAKFVIEAAASLNAEPAEKQKAVA